MKHSLISTDSPLYLKRLAKELNSLPDGFYLAQTGLRYSQAKFSKGILQVKRLTAYLDPQDPRTGANWFDASGMTFTDAYGRSVTVTRRAFL